MPRCDPDLNSPMLELAILAEPRGAWSAGTPESSWDLFFPYTMHLIFPPSAARPCSHSVCLSIRCFLGTYFVPSTYETSPRQTWDLPIGQRQEQAWRHVLLKWGVVVHFLEGLREFKSGLTSPPPPDARTCFLGDELDYHPGVGHFWGGFTSPCCPSGCSRP